MKVTEEMRKRWEPFIESGDQTKLARKLKKHTSTMSRIFNGKEEAKQSLLIKIDNFYKEKEVAARPLTESE